MEHETENVSWIEEIDEQAFGGAAANVIACSTNTFSLSDHLGNTGNWCTLTVECMAWC